jgi:hypothetical protein
MPAFLSSGFSENILRRNYHGYRSDIIKPANPGLGELRDQAKAYFSQLYEAA